MSLRSVILWSLALLTLYVLMSVAWSLWRASRTPAYWRARATELITEDAFRVVALGDSAMQAIGANRPEEGIAGRIASYLETRTGRPVHVTNLAQGGAMVKQVLAQQLPKADLQRAALVLIVTSKSASRWKATAPTCDNFWQRCLPPEPSSPTCL